MSPGVGGARGPAGQAPVEPCRALPQPCPAPRPSPARLTHSGSALGAQSAVTPAHGSDSRTRRRTEGCWPRTQAGPRAGGDVCPSRPIGCRLRGTDADVGALRHGAATDVANERPSAPGCHGDRDRARGSAAHWLIQRRNWRQGRGFLPDGRRGPTPHGRFRPRPGASAHGTGRGGEGSLFPGSRGTAMTRTHLSFCGFIFDIHNLRHKRGGQR